MIECNWTKVTKRDGSISEFDASKIKNAITKANNEAVGDEKISEDEINTITDIVIEKINEKWLVQPTVEDIQDLVVFTIADRKHFNLMKLYSDYRFKRQLIRQSNTTDESIITLIRGNNKELNEENSNKSTILNSTQRDYIAGEVSRDISQRILLPEYIVKAHNEGVIHFHDLDYFLQPMFNCFHSSMRFITKSGIRKFKECKDGEMVEVLDKDGAWRQATVQKFGKQKMTVVRMHSGKSSNEIVCTADHRWILEDGSVTTSLKVGDRLYQLHETGISFADYHPLSIREKLLFTFGMIIGDGNDIYHSGHNSITILLCGDKKKYAEYFRELSYTENQYSDYIKFTKTCKFSKQAFLNSKGWTYLSADDKIALFMGYYAADGCKDRNTIHTTDERIAEMVEDISCIAGYHIARNAEIVHDTNFKRNATLREISFRRYQVKNNLWVVDSIIPYDNHEYDAWCVVEPKTHSFTLEGGIVTGNCCLIAMGDILDNGTVMNGKMIESPHTFRVACTIATQVIAAVASNQYGGQTVDTSHLGKYLRKSKDRIEKKVRSVCKDSVSEEIIQDLISEQLHDELSAGIQTIQYQINTLMTTNGQAPFVTLFMYLRDDDPYIEENAMIIEEIIKQRTLGIKNEKGVYITPAFPKLIYVLDENNSLNGGKYDYITELAVACTAKRMYPDFISAKKMKENKEGTVVPPMGCRSMLSPWKDENGEYKYDGRFNQGVVSINLPQISIVANGDMDLFWKEFDERLQICFDALMCKHKACCEISTDNSPIHWQYGAISRLPKHSDIKELLYGGYSTISLGYIGLYEVTKLMTGVSHTDPKGTEFAMSVMKHLRETTDRWKKETNIGFALYGTPAESLCYRFAKIDRQRFGSIPDITDKGWYTNSYHVDPREKISAFAKLEFESQFQPISSGGCISYVEIPNMQKNLPALREMVKFIYDHIIYAEFNTKSDYCMECGFDGEILLDENAEWYCPNCGNRDHAKMNVVRRTCGYLGENYWNRGRTKEIQSRVLHVD